MEILVFIAVCIVVYVMVIWGKKRQEFISSSKNRRMNVSPKKSYDTVRFKYKDKDGNITERTVDVVVGKKGDTFRAYCHLRKEERTFFFDRIVGYEVLDVRTGEIVTPMEWRYRLQGTKVALAALERERKEIESSRQNA